MRDDRNNRRRDSVLESPEFRHLVARRWRVSLVLTAALFVLYYGYILLIALNKPLVSARLGGAMPIGIPLGAGVIVGAWLLTAAYILWANREYDPKSAGCGVGPRLVRMNSRHHRARRTHRLSHAFFLIIVGLTLAVTWWAARRTRSTREFYAAGRSVSAFQNGLALAGDYMSAASFLGIAGLVALRGYDGMIYATGWLVGWPALMFLIAEPVRNLGKFTFADVVAFRLRQVPVRIAAAFGGILTVLFYTIAQMVGAGNLIRLLFGIGYEWAVTAVGAVMLAYVLFGGMIATTWVQIIKAVLLLFGVTLLTGLVLARFDFSPAQVYTAVAERYGQARSSPAAW